jgi:hypothetical protein
MFNLKEANMKSPIALLRSLFVDLKRLEPDVKGLDRDLETIEKRVKDEGDSFLTITLPRYCEAFVEGLSTSRFTCPMGFKRLKGRAIPILLQGMLSEVFDSLTGHLKPEPSLSVVKATYELLLMFKKLTLSDDQEITLDRMAKDKFFNVDDACHAPFNFDARQLFIIERVSRYILPNIEQVDVSQLFYKHGPGAVSEMLTGNQKWNSVVGHLDQLENFGYDCILYQSELHSQSLPSGPLSNFARLISVPKNSSSRRTITVEPLLNQFKQQGYNTFLRQEIGKCGILRQCLALTDQSKNQKLALEGSRTGLWATIDLSSASDSLSKKLVELVFGSKPLLLEGLIDCRSAVVSSDLVAKPIAKYAGMGNATTFPIQSIVFAVIAISALLRGRKPSYGNVKRVAQSVRVYGDDIIVPSDGSHDVVAWITSAGLTVNTRKSFLEGNFKESCGVDAFRGVDITPLYVRHHPGKLSKTEPSTIAHYVELSNLAWFKGLYTLSAAFVRLAEDTLRSRLPLVRKNSSVLGLHTRQDFTTFQRWNYDLQRPELRGFMLLPIYKRDNIDGYAALCKCLSSASSDAEGSTHTQTQVRFDKGLNGGLPKWLTSLGNSRDANHLSRSPIRFRSRIVQRWVAA